MEMHIKIRNRQNGNRLIFVFIAFSGKNRMICRMEQAGSQIACAISRNKIIYLSIGR
jgi:hypothetical protein